jgi:uncharacterized protein
MHADGTTAGAIARLDRAGCLRLLPRVTVGRLIFTANALPVVRPMNFALSGELIVVRTAEETTVAWKAAGSIVAFEADELDAATCSGWSVTAIGVAALVTDPQVIARYWKLPLTPWAPGARDRFLTIGTEVLEGQLVGPAPPGQAGA